jgi:hypothetical protein
MCSLLMPQVGRQEVWWSDWIANSDPNGKRNLDFLRTVRTEHYKQTFGVPMAAELIRDEGQTLSSPTGKLLGVVETRANLEALATGLKAAGFPKIEYLVGEEGVTLLERVNKFFFSDMEERVLARHIEELKAGHKIVAVEVPSDRVDEATRIASELGTGRLVYFGWMTVTWLTK